jgi:glycosyltransferase involved in cell wall biosynthesis
MRRLPDCRFQDLGKRLLAKSRVMHLGLSLGALHNHGAVNLTEIQSPVLLWNHRWEYDKGPERFFTALDELIKRGIAFRLAITGEAFGTMPEVFQTAERRYHEQLIHFGYCETLSEYAAILHTADYLPVSSRQDFFGISVVEAAACGVQPLLPCGLAYEEHFNNSSLFYNEGDFDERLCGLVAKGKPQSRFDGSSLMRYDWSAMASLYDQAFSEVMD